MGCYINPENMSKEQFLAEKAFLLHDGEPTPHVAHVFKVMLNNSKEYLPIILVNNGPFTAAAIMFSENELHHWMTSIDDRPRSYWYAKIEDLKEVSPIETYLNKA